MAECKLLCEHHEETSIQLQPFAVFICAPLEHCVPIPDGPVTVNTVCVGMMCTYISWKVPTELQRSFRLNYGIGTRE